MGGGEVYNRDEQTSFVDLQSMSHSLQKKKKNLFLDKYFHPIPKCTFLHFSQVHSLCSGWFKREMKYLTRTSGFRGFSWLASIKFQAVTLEDVAIVSSVIQSYKITNPGVHKFFQKLRSDSKS